MSHLSNCLSSPEPLPRAVLVRMASQRMVIARASLLDSDRYKEAMHRHTFGFHLELLAPQYQQSGGMVHHDHLRTSYASADTFGA